MYKLILLLFCLNISSVILAQSNSDYVVNTTTLNMRKGPGKDFDVITTLTRGDAVSVISKTNSAWWLVNAGGNEGFVFAELLTLNPNIGWEPKIYETGASTDCENIDPQYDYKLDNFLRVNVGSNTDVVIKLMQIQQNGDKCIRIVYVRSGDTYDIENIPEARYYLKIAYGKDWRQKNIDGVCYGKFMKSAIYEKGTDILNYYTKNTGSGISIPSFELSLDVISTNKYDSFNANTINEKQFNE